MPIDPSARETLTDLAAMWRQQATVHGFPADGDAATAARALMRTVEALLPYPDDDPVVLRIVEVLGTVFDDVMASDASKEVSLLWLSAQNMASVLTDLLSDTPNVDDDPPSKLVSAVRGPLAMNAEVDG